MLDMLFVVYALSFLSLLADPRIFSKEEAHAFRTLYGTDDMAQLKEIERDPQKFWRERADALRQEGATMSHVDFCAKFVREAKECITQDCPEEKKSFLPQRFQDIDSLIQEKLPESSPILPSAKAYYYSILCDKVHASPHDIDKVVFDEKKGIYGIKDAIYNYSEMTNELNARVRWIVSKDGQFSIFDSLVMRSQGFYLCGVPENPQDRFDFFAHDKEFAGWQGIFAHDIFAHSLQQYRLDEALKDYAISSQEYFNECCHPKRFITGDLIDTSHKILGWFYQFHELPSLNSSFASSELSSLIFPYTGNLSPGLSYRRACWTDLERKASYGSGLLVDTGFLDVVPYFMHVPRDYDWKKKPLQRYPIPAYYEQGRVHEALLGWRAQNCTVGFKFLPGQSVLDYFSSFDSHFSFITPPDIERDSRFFEEMLGYLYRAEQALEKTKRFVDFADFEQKVDAHVQEFLRRVAPMEGNLFVEAPSYFIFVLKAKYAARCKKIADERKLFIFRHGWDAFRAFVRPHPAVPISLDMPLNVAVDDEPASLEQGLRKKVKIA